MKNFKRFSLLSLIWTYALIFMGGLVRVSGAGLGCPDWPKCFGRWIPPTNVTQLPPGVDPTLFNFVLAWTEYINRLLGIVVGLLITVTMILAIKNFRKAPKILIPSIAAFLLVAYQGWQGGQVVISQLEAYTVSWHAAIALIIIGVLVYLNRQVLYFERPDVDREVAFPLRSSAWLGALWMALVLQIILGTHVRSVLVPEHVLTQSAGFGLPNSLTSIDFLHPLMGFIIALYTWLFGFSLLKRAVNLSSQMKNLVWGMMAIMLLQVLIGGAMVIWRVPGLMQIFHLWVVAFFIGMLLVINIAYSRFSHAQRIARAEKK